MNNFINFIYVYDCDNIEYYININNIVSLKDLKNGMTQLTLSTGEKIVLSDDFDYIVDCVEDTPYITHRRNE